jgi:glycosyltransferase involved in cell wall biosynthesis
MEAGEMPSGDTREAGRAGAGRGMVFIAWGAVGGRSLELAEALGADFLTLYPPSSRRRPPAPVRYLLGSLQTGRYLLRHRPRTAVVTNPPIIAGLVTYAWGRLVGTKIVLDSHPGGFGAQGDRVAARLQKVHKWLVGRAAFSFVASPKWGDVVHEWGGETEVVHEAPGAWRCSTPIRGERLKVLFVGRFAGDEPVEEFVAAVAQVPEIDVAMTGDLARCPPGMQENAPSNLTFVGFLDPPGYVAAVTEADVVVCLTTESGSVMRSAYEAVYACRPLIVTGWPISREVFPYAVQTENLTPDLVTALKTADAHFDELVGVSAAARELQLGRFEEQRQAVLRRIAALGTRS